MNWLKKIAKGPHPGGSDGLPSPSPYFDSGLTLDDPDEQGNGFVNSPEEIRRVKLKEKQKGK